MYIRFLHQILLRAALLLAGGLLAISCNDSKEDNPSESSSAPTAIRIAGGGWKGHFYATDGTRKTSLTATITQDRDAVIITTSLAPNRIGHKFTGTIKSSGEMRLTDSFDGEIWSTFFGPAHANYIKIADFKEPPGRGQPNDDFYILEISRKGASRPANVQFTDIHTTNNPSPDPAPTTPPATTPSTPSPVPTPTPIPTPEPLPTPDPLPTPPSPTPAPGG